MKLSNNVGVTPLLKISDKIYAKLELLNPTGSIKDRPASHIINEAEKMELYYPEVLFVKPLLEIWVLALHG